MTGDLFYYYSSPVSRLDLILNVKFSGSREYNKDDLFGFERLKVNGNYSHGCGNILYFLVSKVLSHTLSSITCFL